MTNQDEGAKPQLSIVETPAVSASTVLLMNDLSDLDQDFACYADKLAAIIGYLTKRQIHKQAFSAVDTLKLLDAKEDNAPIRDWMVNNNVMSKAFFDSNMRRIERENRIHAALGFVPKDAEDYVRRFAETQNITLTPAGVVKRDRAYKVGTDEVNRHNCDTSEATRLVYDVANAEGANIDSLGRELRLIADKFDLGFRDSVISDAIAAWLEDTTRQMKVDALMAIAFERGLATGQAGTDMWAKMEAACFDTTATKPGFPIAVMRKFMWQVKRKARGMSVTNHLMPVLTGPQGKGKTQFVLKLTKPLEHFKREVDFNLITDGKTADIWSSLILFIDEMGFAKKADVDVVKNAITAEARSIRTMRQNHSAPVANQSTLIGCSNKSLGQLFRDETGGRRFAELVWLQQPDWDALNDVDWVMLWKSVDEKGPDPMVAANFMNVLAEQQEENRNQHPVEIWIREEGHTYKKWTLASEIHRTFREWEQVAFPRSDTNQNTFGRTLTNLIATIPDFPLEKQQGRKGIQYRFKDTDND